MATSANDVRRDIEQARAELGQTLEAIGDRVAPKKVVARAKENVSEKVEDVKENVKEKVSPGRLVRRPVDATKRGFHSIMGSDENTGAGASAKDKAGQVTARAGEVTTSASGVASSAASSVAGTVRGAPQAIQDKAEGNPLAAGLLAAAAGFFAASLLRPTDRERQLVRQAVARLEPLKQEVAQRGKDVAGELQESAKDRFQHVAETAQHAVGEVREEAASTARELTERARDEAAEVKEEAQSSAEKVKEDAKDAAQTVKTQTRRSAATVKGRDGSATTRQAAAPAPKPAPGRRPRRSSADPVIGPGASRPAASARRRRPAAPGKAAAPRTRRAPSAR